MGDVYFYHLTSATLEQTLPMLLAKARGAGWRVLVRGCEESRMDWLDEKLWLGPEDQFLAHGRSGDDYIADQPILLTTGTENPNAATCLMAVDGAAVDVQEISDMDRVCVLFDGNDSTSLETARGQWKSLTDAGCSAQYWAQDGGKWAKKADSGGLK